jgi:rhodanese-related sulfurtransferase
MAEGTLRENFYYRIHVFEITLPPLRTRQEDIPLLVHHFIAENSKTFGRDLFTSPRLGIFRLPDLHMFVEELKGLSQVRPLILVWRTQNRVKIAYDYLTNNGVSNCRILKGGITGWVNSGKPVIRGHKSFSLEGQVRAIAGSLMVLGVGLGISVNLWFLLIPVLVEIGLIHAGLTDLCLMGMVLSRLSMNQISPPSIPISRK